MARNSLDEASSFRFNSIPQIRFVDAVPPATIKYYLHLPLRRLLFSTNSNKYQLRRPIRDLPREMNAANDETGGRLIAVVVVEGSGSAAPGEPPAGGEDGEGCHPPAEQPAPNKEQRTIITNDAKLSLRAYFIDENWPLNRNLPLGAAFNTGALADIMNKFGLNRAQVARQLNNYKKTKYQHTQLNIIMGSSDLENMLRDGLTMSTSEFVARTLNRMCNPQPADGKDFNNILMALNNYPPEARVYLSLIAGSPENSCFGLLVGLVEYWTIAMAENLPKTAGGLPNAELEFVKRREGNMCTFLHAFKKEYDSSGLADVLSEEKFGNLGRFVHVLLFMTWLAKVCDYEKPPIEVPVDCLVGKYAQPVIYYVAGWTLFRATKALTVAENKKPMHRRFADAHSMISGDDAKSAGLPTSLVDRRKRGNQIYCTREYYDFICMVESVYLANLTLKMMLAYDDGNIIARIKSSLLTNTLVRERFATLFAFSGGAVVEKEQTQIMEYILERYANMRGNFFARHLKCNSGDLLAKHVDNQATRTKVLHATHCTKVGNSNKGSNNYNDDSDGDDDRNDETFEMDATPEHQLLWESAANSVVGIADKEEESDDDDEELENSDADSLHD